MYKTQKFGLDIFHYCPADRKTGRSNAYEHITEVYRNEVLLAQLFHDWGSMNVSGNVCRWEAPLSEYNTPTCADFEILEDGILCTSCLTGASEFIPYE